MGRNADPFMLALAMPSQTPDVPLIDLEEARRRLLALCAPVVAREAVIARVEDGFLAQDVLAASDAPVCDVAARDGFACASLELVGASAFTPAFLSASPAWVNVGEPLPEACDCVLEAGCVDIHGPVVAAHYAAAPGEGVLRAGEDAQAGVVLASAGARMNAALASLLHAAGLRSASLRRPGLRIVVAPGHADPSTGALVCALAQAAGARVDMRVAAGRSLEDMRAALDVSGVDALVSVGGAGCGDNDFTIAALRAAGAQPLRHGVALSPGGHVAFGALWGTPTLALPGRPDGALAGWLCLGSSMFAALAGAQEAAALEAGPLARKISSAPGVSELVLVRREEGAWAPFGAGASPLSAMARAQGYLILPAASEGMAAGARVAPYAASWSAR